MSHSARYDLPEFRFVDHETFMRATQRPDELVKLLEFEPDPPNLLRRLTYQFIGHYGPGICCDYHIPVDDHLPAMHECWIEVAIRSNVIQKFDWQRPFGGWFYWPVHHGLLHGFRAVCRKKERYVGDGALFPDDGGDLDSLSDWKPTELREVFDKLVSRLPKKLREIADRFLLGQSRAQIRRELDINPGTLRRRLDRIKDRLLLDFPHLFAEWSNES